MKQIFTVFLMLLLGWSAYAQTTVSGTVTSTKGETLPGVNVLLKGSTKGTVTDVTGRYNLEVSDLNGTLTFSYIGYQSQEVEINGQSSLDVQMREDVTELGEIIVTAVGIEREQKALGYAVSKLDDESVQQVSEPDVLRAISGKVPGVNITGSGGAVGGSTNIIIRGNSSLTGNNQPLFVVDGVPFNNALDQSTSFTGGNQYSNRAIDLDPNIIESITVLKGAAAAALYGSRATNGVIVITTKAGSGGGNKGFEITLNNSFNVETVASLPKLTQKYGQGGANQWARGFVGNWGAHFDSLDRVPHPYSGGPGAIPFPEFDTVTVPYQPHDNARDFFREGYVLENSISINSGNENSSLSATVSRMKQEGIIPNSEFERVAVNLGGNAQLTNRFYINSTINYVKTDQFTASIAPGIAGGSSVLSRLLFTPVSINLKSLPYQDPITGGNVYYRDDQDNPYWAAENTGYSSLVNRYFGKITLGYDLAEWLKISYQAGYNGYTDQRTSFTRKGSYDNELGSMFTDNYTFEELNGVFLATLNKDITRDFNLNVNLGNEISQRTWERESVNGNEFIVYGLDRLNNTVTQTSFEDYYRRRYVALFADVTLGYKNFAFLNLVARNDWSSTLPQEESSYFYSGVSGSLIVTDAFNIQSDILSFVKLRAGISQVGNEADPYLTTTPYVINGDIDGGFAGYEIGFPFTNRDGNTYNNLIRRNVLGNSELRPEFTTEYEAGIETKLFGNRIGLDATYYFRSTTDQIVDANIAPSTGYNNTTINVGEVTNEGWELGLDLNVLPASSSFQWNVYSAFTRNRNLVVAIDDQIDQILVGGYTNLGIVHRAGLPYGQLLGNRAARADDGTLLINSQSGLLIEDPVGDVVIGDPNPDFQLGITNTFSFKGITVRALIDWRRGGDLYSQSANQLLSRGALEGTDLEREKPRIIPGYLATPTGEIILDENGAPIANNIPVTANEMFFIDGYSWFDDLMVFDASYVKLREVTISYQLPASLLEKTPFGSANISFSGRNLWFNAYNMPDALNIDPEISATGAGNAQGLEFINLPNTRRYGVNLQFTF